MQRILFLDDSIEVCALYKGPIEELGYTVDIANSAEDAKEMVEARKENYEPDYYGFIVDLRLHEGKMQGDDFIEEIRGCCAYSVFVIITSHLAQYRERVEELCQEENTRSTNKPLDTIILKKLLELENI